MRFALNSDHKDFYSKNSFIEFDELLTPDSLASLQSDIETTLSHRLKVSPSRLPDQPRKALFDAGFDIWRDSSNFKKTLFKSTVSEIAAQLFEESFLRIGFDQYIDTGSGSEALLTSSLSFNDLSCAKPLIGALILRLSPPTDETIDPQICPIPSKAGSGIFVSPSKIIPWSTLFAEKNLRLLILAYASKRSIYHLEKNDPHTHVWKGLGYVFGDRLNDNLHPVIHRS